MKLRGVPATPKGDTVKFGGSKYILLIIIPARIGYGHHLLDFELSAFVVIALSDIVKQASPDENPSFAVKRLHHDSYKAFNDEVSSLKRFSEKDYVHLIKLLVTFSWRKKYYLLFPWADGNLLDFWRLYPQPSYPQRNHNLAIWFSDQCRGLVQGLKMIHIGDMPSTDNLPDMQKNQIHGRHGDLKPENILWFKSYKERTNQQFSGVMKISDFGLMRFHSTQSKSNVENVAVSRTYRPPE